MLDAKGLEAAKAVFNNTYVTKDGPLTAAITAYLQAVGPEPAVAVKPLVNQIDALLTLKNPVPRIPNLARSLLASARSALVATPPAEPVVEALTDDAIRTYVKDHSIYLRESASVPDIQNGGWKHPYSLTITGDELRKMVAALAAKDGRS